MAYQITIKNSLNEKLKELKGKGSYSDAIEKLIEENEGLKADRL